MCKSRLNVFIRKKTKYAKHSGQLYKRNGLIGSKICKLLKPEQKSFSVTKTKTRGNPSISSKACTL